MHSNEPSIEEQRRSYLSEHLLLTLVLLFTGWTLAVGYSLYWNEGNLERAGLALATREAQTLWNKDQAIRQWATRHGGVYIEPDARTPPNPYLQHLPDRDVETTQGKRLTLMNPAYMMRQMAQEFEESYGIKGKVTALKYLNPVNAPDEWELAALRRFAAGDAEPVTQETWIEGEPFLRFIRPIYMKPGCDKCHGVLGFATGDMRGGVSVSVPLRPYREATSEMMGSVRTTHLGVWMCGNAGLLLFGFVAQKKRTERRALLARLERDALYDRLTGLPTRALCEDRIRQAIRAKARLPHKDFAVCFIDLDRFKRINDNLGHSVGDDLLRQVGRLLAEVIRPADTAARLAGDEFVLLLDGIDTTDEAIGVARRVLDRLRTRIVLAERTTPVGASIGICMGGSGNWGPDEIIRNADIAMFQAKRAGEDIAVFSEAMHAAVVRAGDLEARLRSALLEDQFELMYQPIVNLAEDRIVGFEALLRWNHPQFGAILPDQFVPIAEEIGLVQAIGEWVCRRAIAQLDTWKRKLGDEEGLLSMSINVSARQLGDGTFTELVRTMLDGGSVCPEQICIDVTETALIHEASHAEAALQTLHRLGCRLSADDFGTGYSSLTYLQSYPFDAIKLDKQFVADASARNAGMKLCNALIGLARDLSMTVIAEGVESAAQCDQLRRLGCDWMQGYYFSPPLTAERVDALFDEGLHLDLRGLILRAAA